MIFKFWHCFEFRILDFEFSRMALFYRLSPRVSSRPTYGQNTVLHIGLLYICAPLGRVNENVALLTGQSFGPIESDTNFSRSSRPTMPSLKIRGGSTVTSRIVDPFPPCVSPPSRIKSTESRKESTTCSGLVGAGSPETLALVPVIGRPAF